MSDELKFRANSLTHTAWSDDRKVRTTTWRDGRVQTFDRSRVSTACDDMAAQQGWDTRLDDAKALDRAKYATMAAFNEAKFDRVQRLIDHYSTGTEQWNLAVAAAKGPDFDLIEEAVEAWQSDGGRTADVEGLLAMTISTKRAEDREGALLFWANSDKVKEHMRAILAARAPKPKLDADAEMIAMLKAADEWHEKMGLDENGKSVE